MDLAEISPENAIELGRFGFIRVLRRRSETDPPRSDSREENPTPTAGVVGSASSRSRSSRIYRVGRATG